jgi:hypothetical protein
LYRSILGFLRCGLSNLSRYHRVAVSCSTVLVVVACAGAGWVALPLLASSTGGIAVGIVCCADGGGGGGDDGDRRCSIGLVGMSGEHDIGGIASGDVNDNTRLVARA